MTSARRQDFDELIDCRYRALHTQARKRLDDNDLDQVIHDERVTLKQLRALWQLAKPTVDSKLPAISNRRLRDTGRELGPARDARVADSTLDEIVKSVDDSATRAAFVEFRTRIVPAKTVPEESEIEVALTKMSSVLEEDAAAWRIYLEQAEGKALMTKGLRRTYRKAQQWALDAVATSDPEMAHRWRRWVKYLRYQLELFGDDAPEWIEQYRNRVTKLGQMLGSRNDLAVLRKRLKTVRGELNSDQYKRIAKTLKKREKSLDMKCQKLGKKIFDESTGRFVRRVEKAFAEWQKSRAPKLTVVEGRSPEDPQRSVA